MSGIYLHIPFCKQACYYCDFHFSTSLKKKSDLVTALVMELQLRKNELKTPIETIYFGGGTPSLLTIDEIQLLLKTITNNYIVVENPEITLEANPDDLSEEKIIDLSKTPINRLSIGVQSFFEDDLQLMNRAHNAQEVEKCLTIATPYFDNITIDLIYGIPNMSNQKWEANIDKALAFGINHVSSYALTVEPKTAYANFIKKGELDAPKDEVSQQHFEILVQKLKEHNFVHYELSNFGKSNYFSKHNTSYWLGKHYLGIGPSAHSFNGTTRSWNISNNAQYIKVINSKTLPLTTEILSENDQFNEYIMTGLRTMFGVSLEKVEKDFGVKFKDYLMQSAAKFIAQNLLIIENNILKTTPKGKFLCDGIAADLFLVN